VSVIAGATPVDSLEYLVSYGLAGDFGRFRAARPLALRRGDRVVVRSARGVEVGAVLREATPRHAAFLPNTTVGQLLRPAGPDDEAEAGRLGDRGFALLDRARRLADELGLPLEPLDVEVLLDGRHADLHVLRRAGLDVRPFVSTLSREFDLHLLLTDLGGPAAADEPEEAHGCGREGCGSGGCGACGSGGCGTCGSAAPEEVTAYFAELREQMERRRTPLL
jgi:hypothetical protein